MKEMLLTGFLLYSAISYAQKKVELKKGDLLADGQKIASYDSKGGVMSTNRNFWVFAPDTKDTLLSINQVDMIFENPMFENWIYYKVDVKGTNASSFYIKNPKGWGYVGEKRVFGLIFNDNLPLFIENAKVNLSSLEAFKTQAAYNFDSLMAIVKTVNDTANSLANVVIQRNNKEPLSYKLVNDKKYFPKFYTPEVDLTQKTEVYQDGKLVGGIEKEVSGGAFATGHYVIYKAITPITINGISISMIPIAFAKTSPGISSAVTNNNIFVKSMDNKQVAIVPPAPYNQADAQIVKALIAANLL